MFIEFGRETTGRLDIAQSLEWLVTNGIGGFASGTVANLNIRRYHGLLLAALNPPLGCTLLLAKLDETVAYDGSQLRGCAVQIAERDGRALMAGENPRGIGGHPLVKQVHETFCCVHYFTLGASK